MSTPNVTKGGQLVLSARNDGDTEWEVIGGVTSRDFAVSNADEVITSSSTNGTFNESQWVGYTDMTINISGVADKRSGFVDDASGYNVVGKARLLTLATTGERCGTFQLLNVDTMGTIEGEFHIGDYSETAETTSVVNFSASLKSQKEVVIVGDV